MKRGILTFLTVSTLFMVNSMSVLAAPEIMPDGGIFDAEYYAENNPDVVRAFGTDKVALYSHYVNNGRAEGRQGFLITKDMYTTCPVASEKTLELLASGGTEGVHYIECDWRIIGEIYRYYRLRDDEELWGDLVLERTDFADGLIDFDGNGIDDRDPVNSLGFIDLNLNGIDDRDTSVGGMYTGKTDLEIYPDVCSHFGFDYGNYLCEHGVVCKSEISSNILCVKCRAIKEAERADYNRRHSGHVSDDKGYKVGSTISRYEFSGKEIILTYQGNDVWCDSEGRTWYAYLDENDRIQWRAGVH